jgi:membrane-associated phospholipid phosphatase
MVLWSTNRQRFRSWIWCVSLLVAIGTICYIVYPMAPPWVAGGLGMAEPIARISGIGWEFLHLDVIGNLQGQAQLVSNPVAAMPSMHAASAALVTAFFWAGAAPWGRMLLTLYPVAMGITLVYTGEHYVVDVLAGCLAAGAVVVGWRLVARRKQAGRKASRPSAPAPAAGGD